MIQKAGSFLKQALSVSEAHSGSMPQQARFTYKIRDASGEVKEGQIMAGSLNEAVRMLEKKSRFILLLEKIPQRQDFLPSRLRIKDLITFFKALSMMAKSGLNVRNTLSIMEAQAESSSLAMIFHAIKKAIEEGKSFSEALGLFPAVFTNFHRSIVRASEKGGFFSEGLWYLADVLEKEYILGKKVRAALNYPFIVFCVGMLICGAVFYWILPMLTTLVKDMSVKLPFYSQIIITLGECMRKWYIFIPSAVIAVLTVVYLFIYLSGTLGGKLLWDRLILEIPVMGEIKRKAVLTHAAIMLSCLTKSGEHIVKALEMAGDTCENLVIGRAFLSIADSVMEGDTLGDSMGMFPAIFPRTMVAMVTVGEESGELPEVLSKTAVIFELELDSLLAAFTKLVEPMAIVVLGIVISILLLSMFVPIYAAMNAF
ncbi:MAG: type II secretion system F family protein [Candidatus Eremiobacteraeota bacterium]|nr:type II secretion system F family protein [Candidatus Eremiobacteraeota bacterium]